MRDTLVKIKLFSKAQMPHILISNNENAIQNILKIPLYHTSLVSKYTLIHIIC